MTQTQASRRRQIPGGMMIFNLTAVLSACTLISCATLVASDGDTKRPGPGNSGPLTRANGSGGSNGSNNNGGNGSDGSRSHGLDGERWQDRVPREPMWFINAGSGQRNSSVHPEDNAKGLAVWWRGDRAVDELINRIHQGYDVGARWFYVNRPMGTPGNTHVPAASWLTLNEDKRNRLPEMLTQAVLDEFDEPVHLVWFIGSELTDPRDFAGWSPGRDDDFYELGEDGTWEELIGSRVTLGGWLSTGASGLAIDHSSPVNERGHFIKLFEQLNGFPFHLAIYGEGLPIVFDNNQIVRDQGGTPLLDQHAIESMPWLGSDSYLDIYWPPAAQSDAFPLDTEKTRMFVWFSHSTLYYGREDERVEMVNRFLDKGFIPITQDPVMFRIAQDRLRASQSSQSNESANSGSRQGRTQTRNSSQVQVKRRGPKTALPKRYQPRGTQNP